jgi:uncharacterized protein
MRRKDKEITSKIIIEEVFQKSDLCRIALIDQDKPYIVPLNYGYSEGKLYFHSAPSGRKIDIIRKNNKVCFEIEYGCEIIKSETSCQWSAKYRSVIGYGTIEIITDNIHKKEGLDIIMTHYGKTNNSYDDNKMNRMVILRLTIDEIACKQSGIWK